jgi:hypothetical protein
MYDRRVIRGITCVPHALPASAQPDPIEVQRQQEARRRVIAKRRAQQQLRVHSPEPVEGRQHIDVQTELYLEELSDLIEETEVECQTDAFLDRPPSPLFIPAKTGVDCETQILDGELFNFNIEVKPVLEVLVGKTLEQALIEVMEEEELSNLREQQRQFQELRNAELVEQQRLEEEDRRRRLEKERRVQQQLEAIKKEAETSEKIAARAFAQSCLADLVPSVFVMLKENGYFYDPVERAVESDFMPWLTETLGVELSKSVLSRQLLDGMVREVVHTRARQFAQLEAEEASRMEQEQAEHEAAIAAAAVPVTEESGEKPAEGDAEITAPVGLAEETTAGDEATDHLEPAAGDNEDDETELQQDDD